MRFRVAVNSRSSSTSKVSRATPLSTMARPLARCAKRTPKYAAAQTKASSSGLLALYLQWPSLPTSGVTLWHSASARKKRRSACA
eukprot:2668815-Prorocentrum_lima.AAC.1